MGEIYNLNLTCFKLLYQMSWSSPTKPITHFGLIYNLAQKWNQNGLMTTNHLKTSKSKLSSESFVATCKI